MDPQMTEKVNELAQNLKKLHLAATVEEAFERAREIIVSSKETSVESSQKPIKDLVNDSHQ